MTFKQFLDVKARQKCWKNMTSKTGRLKIDFSYVTRRLLYTVRISNNLYETACYKIVKTSFFWLKETFVIDQKFI